MATAATEPDPTAAAIRVRGVTKEFGSGGAVTRALRGVDLDVAYGEMLMLVGPSGCGKTTLVSIIAGTLAPTSGDVVVLGRDLVAMANGAKVRFRRENVGFVFQSYNLLPALTAAENAAVPLLIAGQGRREAVEKAADVLAALGLGDRLANLPAELSGGQQQRVAIARALVHDPRPRRGKRPHHHGTHRAAGGAAGPGRDRGHPRRPGLLLRRPDRLDGGWPHRVRRGRPAARPDRVGCAAWPRQPANPPRTFPFPADCSGGARSPTWSRSGSCRSWPSACSPSRCGSCGGRGP
jgi:ABC-type lipoprotein export system ATPase subunit